MPSKYIIVGATFNGDGTTSTEAASDGGVGAWSGLEVMEGTAPSAMTPAGAGAVDAGDVVYIRSKTSAGADISRAYTAVTLGSAAATLLSPVTWVLDDGAIWAGIDGTLTYTSSTASHTIALRYYNRYISSTRLRWLLQNLTTSNSVVWLTTNASLMSGLHLNWPNRTTSVTFMMTQASGASDENCRFTTSDLHSTHALMSTNVAEIEHVGLEIEITDPSPTGGLIFGFAGNHSHHRFIGGRIFGPGATTGIRLSNLGLSTNNAYSILGIGFQVPKTVDFSGSEITTNNWASLSGMDGGLGAALYEPWGLADSRNIANYYPYLNASNPDSTASGVSWRVYPRFASALKPARLVISKVYSSAAAAKKVTLEVLAHDSWTGGALNKSTVWMRVSYIDSATGLPTGITTMAESVGALDTSTAAWSATTWGAVGLTKYKLELTTPSSIKQDTAVAVAFYCSSTSGSANDIFIVCPDPQLSTP